MIPVASIFNLGGPDMLILYLYSGFWIALVVFVLRLALRATRALEKAAEAQRELVTQLRSFIEASRRNTPEK
jgi:hypothetical protein